MFEYHTTGTCSKIITFRIVDGKLEDIRFDRGCDGNSKALARLLEGMSAFEAVEKLEGIQCGSKGTSCADQLSKAIVEAGAKII